VTKPASVRVSTYVDVSVEDAFDVFTSEIDAWYQRGPHNFADPGRALAIRFEPFAGGRLIEVYDADSGDGYELARVEVWDPPERLVFRDNRATTVEVVFEPVDHTTTKVTLEHRGFDHLDPATAFHVRDFGWALVFRWFDEYMRLREERA
jgi:hypothetical protein